MSWGACQEKSCVQNVVAISFQGDEKMTEEIALEIVSSLNAVCLILGGITMILAGIMLAILSKR